MKLMTTCYMRCLACGAQGKTELGPSDGLKTCPGCPFCGAVGRNEIIIGASRPPAWWDPSKVRPDPDFLPTYSEATYEPAMKPVEDSLK